MPEPLLALDVKPLDYGSAALAGTRLQSMDLGNQIEQYKANQAGRNEAALARYQQSGDPRDLAGTPEMDAQRMKLQQATQEFQNTRNARDAQILLATTKENTPDRQAQWQSHLDARFQDGSMPPLVHTQLSQMHPNDEMLKGLIRQATPIQPAGFGPVANTQFGIPVPGFHDPNTGTVSVPPTAGATGVAGAGNPSINQEGTGGGLTGNALLDHAVRTGQLDQGTANEVQQILDGRAQYPSPSVRTPRAMMIRNMVALADPTFDAVNYNGRANTWKDFTSGPTARNVIAPINQTMMHLSTLSDKIDALGNKDYYGGDLLRSWLINPVARRDPEAANRIRQFETARDAVARELSRVFKGANISDSEVKDWESKVNAASSTTELKGFIQTAIELLNGRIEATADQFHRGMGGTRNFADLIMPEARQAYAKITGQQPQGTGTGGQVDVGAPSGKGDLRPPPQQGQNAGLPRITGQSQQDQDAQYEALPPGRYLDPKGQIRVKAGPPAGSPKNPYKDRADAQKEGDYAVENGRLLRRTGNMIFGKRWEDVGPALGQDSLLGTR